jgi:hypothetical protein
MNDIGKPSAWKQARPWALEAFLPALLMWLAMVQTASGLIQIGRNPGLAILQMVIGLFLAWVAFCTLVARLRKDPFRL